MSYIVREELLSTKGISSALFNHQKQVKNAQQIVAGMEETKGYHEEKDEKKHYVRTCLKCNRTFNQKSDIERHVAICGKGKEPRETDVPCTECTKVFRTPHAAIEHFANSHTKFFLYLCENCDFHTNYQSHISAHKHKNKCKNDQSKYVQVVTFDQSLEDFKNLVQPKKEK